MALSHCHVILTILNKPLLSHLTDMLDITSFKIGSSLFRKKIKPTLKPSLYFFTSTLTILFQILCILKYHCKWLPKTAGQRRNNSEENLSVLNRRSIIEIYLSWLPKSPNTSFRKIVICQDTIWSDGVTGEQICYYPSTFYSSSLKAC